MSPDERRIADWITARSLTYLEAAERNPFSLHRVRAKLCMALAEAIMDGKHRA